MTPPRLLKVLVQPVFVTEDGPDLSEHVVQPLPLTAAQWRTLDPETWADEMVTAVERRLGAQNSEESHE